MDDFDIYSDLPDFAWLKQAYEEDVEIKKEELPISEKEVKELKEKLLKLEKVHKLVLSHYSSLWKTSKQERKRMDRQIADLRRQLDNFAFKRNHRTNVPPPAELEPPTAYSTNLLPSNNSQYNYPPPLMGMPVSLNPQVNQNIYNHPPPPINPTICTNQEWKKGEEEELHEHSVDNYAVPSNVITPENSHSSDESEDDVVKKSEYRSTVYGERLRKKLLEEKRNAMKLKKESTLDKNKKDHENPKQKQNGSENIDELNRRNNNEVISIRKESDTRTVVKEFSTQEQKLINERTTEQLNQNPEKLGTLNEENKLNGLKEKEVKSVIKETDIKTVKEGSNNKQYKEIETQNIRDQTLKKEEVESEGNKNVVEPSTKRETDIDRRKKEEDLRKKVRDDVDEKQRDNDTISSRDREFNKKTEDEEAKLKRERDLARRKRGNESRMRRERDLDKRRKEKEIEKTKREERLVKKRDEEELDRRRKEEEIDKTKREERLVKRRDEEEIDRRRKEEEIEKTKREERLVKRRDEEEIERRRKDQEIERRRKEEIDKRRRSEIERKRRDQEIERRRKDELNRRRKIEDEKRKERELEILKEKENERRRKEEELHAMKLKDIEKKRNEKQLEELIKERIRIENEMNTLNGEKSEEEENAKSIKNTICKEKDGKSQNYKGQPKEVSKDNSKQSSKNQEATGKNDKVKVDQHSCANKGSSSVDSNRPTMNDKRKDDFREYSSSKSDRYQSNYTGYENRKYNERRSKRDQLDRENEPRKSLHRNKSRHRNESNSYHRNDEGRRSCSPKRMKLLERDDRHHDNLKNLVPDKNDKNTVKSPKRRRLSKSEERSPQKIKKRKISQDKDQDSNAKLDANSAQRINVTSSAKLEEDTLLDNRKTSDNCAKNIINTATSDKNISTSENGNRSQPTDEAENVNENKKMEKVGGDEVLTHLIDPQKTTQVLSKTENQVKDSNENQSKLTKNRTDKQINSHANRKKTLIDDLFETREESVDASADLKNVEKVDKTLNETVLSDLEEGEIEESDESMDTEYLPKPTSHSLPTNKPIIMQSSDKNENDENVTSLLKNNKETALKCPNEPKHSILHNLLTQRENDTSIQKTKIKSDEKISYKTESDNVKTCKKTETCNNIVNGPADKSSQIIDEKDISVNETKTIECRDNNEAVDSEVVNNRVLPKVEITETIAVPSDNVITIMKTEKETTQEKTNGNVTVEKADSEKSAECISNPTNVAPDISSKQPDQNCLKNNNSEGKHDKKRIQHLKRTDIYSETNNMKSTCSKENVNVNNDCIKKTSGNSANTKLLNEEPLKSITKSETPAKDDAIKNCVLTPTRVPMRNIIVIKRRRRPVQLSDSPPVVVINNFTGKT